MLKECQATPWTLGMLSASQQILKFYFLLLIKAEVFRKLLTPLQPFFVNPLYRKNFECNHDNQEFEVFNLPSVSGCEFAGSLGGGRKPSEAFFYQYNIT